MKTLCVNGSWNYSKDVATSPAIFDLRFKGVDLDEKSGIIYIYFESEINLYVPIDSAVSRVKVEYDCRSFCEGRATKFASRVREEILPEYQRGSVGYYFSRFHNVKSIIKFHVKK